MTSSYSDPWSSLTVTRVGARVAALGASLGLVAGALELGFGPHIRSWVGDKQDTTRLGLATIALSAIALSAAVTWLRRRSTSPGTRLLIVVGLVIPGAICFTTVGRVWYLPGVLLIAAAGIAAADLREDVGEVAATIGRNWLSSLTFVLGGFYVFLGATALGAAGTLGIIGGTVIAAVVATSAHIPLRVGRIVLAAAALPFALLTWWSIVTPLLAILIVVIGSSALRHRSLVAVRRGG
jgi:hypothetical protein